MTTIAYRDGVLAGDGRETSVEEHESPYVLRDDCRKVFKLPDGRLFAAARGSEDGLRLHALLKQSRGGFPTIKLDDINALLIDLKGRIWYYEGNVWQPVKDKFYAIGSGARVGAWPALLAGASALGAVKIGVKCDPYSGGRISSVRLAR